MSTKHKNKRVGICLTVGTLRLTKRVFLAVKSKAILGSLIMLLCFFLTGPVQAQGQPCEGMDIVLVLDITGGMKHIRREIKSSAADITAAMALAADDVRAGLVTFREGVFVERDLTSDLNLVEGALSALQANGGAGVPENWDGALNLAANRGSGFFYEGGPCQVFGTLASFRPDCRKLVVLLTDAPPSGCNDEYVVGEDDVRAMSIADAASANGVLVSTILSDNGDDGGEQALLEYCAAATGGTFAVVPDQGPDAAMAIQAAIMAQACPPVPTVTITDPPDGSTFASGAVVSFSGLALDYLNTDISADINWFLNDDPNPFATGATSQLDFGIIGDGTHSIMAAATDDNGTGSDAVTITVGTSPEPTVVSVESITYTTAAKGKHLKITIHLEDDFGAPVSGASVSINLLRDGSLDLQASGTTGIDGTVTFSRNQAPTGTYTSVVTNVAASDLIWDGTTPPNEFIK